MNRLDDKPLFIALFIFTLASYFFSCLAFIVPKWYAMYPGSMSTFQNIGLWEICFSSFIHEEIYDQLYSDCFYIGSPTLSDLYSWIVRNWFLGSQIIFTISFIGAMSASLICVLMFLGLLSAIQRKNTILLIILHSMSSLTCLITLILFGVNTKDMGEYQWMPNPSQCSLSWSYGSAALSLLGSMVCLGLLSHVLRFHNHNYVSWSCNKNEMYKQNPSAPMDVDIPSNLHVEASIYDPRGTSSPSKISGDRDRSLLSSRLGPSHRSVAKNENNPAPSIISNQSRPHFQKSSKEKKSEQSGSSQISENPSSRQSAKLLTAKEPKKSKPQGSLISEQPTHDSDYVRPTLSPAPSQLTVTSRNASSVVIAAKPMKRH